MTSINTNASATTALRTLQQTNKSLETTQNRISTGLKIGEAKDNAAYWAISTTLKSDNKSLATVKDALSLGAATVDTAYQGLNKTKEVLDEIKAKLTAASQDGVDRDVIQTEIASLKEQLKSIAGSAVFSGENWLSINSADTSFSSNKKVVSSFTRDSSNGVTIGTIDIDISTAALFDANNTTNSRGILDTAGGLTTADGRTLAIGGKVSTLGNTSVGGLATAATTATGANAVPSFGVFDGSFIPMTAATNFVDAGDTLTFTFTVEGASKTVAVTKADATLANGASAAGEIKSVSELANIFNAKVTTQGVEAYVTGAGTLGVRSIVPGTATTVIATTVAVTDNATTAGFTLAGTGLNAAPTAGLQTDGIDATKATVYSAATSAVTLDSDDQISFVLKSGNDAGKAIIIDKALIDDALGGATGTITSTANWATVVQAALTKAGVKAQVAVDTVNTARLKFESTVTGSTSSLTISEVKGVAGPSTISLMDIDISKETLTALGAVTGDQVRSVLSAYVSIVNTAMQKVTTAAANLGSVAKRVETQKTFADTLIDTIDKGVSELIDADLSEESTRLQALQTKQQLGIQALSIANSSQQNILRLFQ